MSGLPLGDMSPGDKKKWEAYLHTVHWGRGREAHRHTPGAPWGPVPQLPGTLVENSPWHTLE